MEKKGGSKGENIILPFEKKKRCSSSGKKKGWGWQGRRIGKKG